MMNLFINSALGRDFLMNKLLDFMKSKPFITALILIVLLNEYTKLPLQDFLSYFMPYQNALMISIFVLQMSNFAFLLYLSKKLGISYSYNLKLSKLLKSLYITIPFYFFSKLFFIFK